MCTCYAGIIYQDDLFEQDGRRCVQNTVDRPQEGRPSLIVEDDNNAGAGQRRTATKLPLHTSEQREPQGNTKREGEKKKQHESKACGRVSGSQIRSHRASYNRPLFADIQGLFTNTLNSSICKQPAHLKATCDMFTWINTYSEWKC